MPIGKAAKALTESPARHIIASAAEGETAACDSGRAGERRVGGGLPRPDGAFRRCDATAVGAAAVTAARAAAVAGVPIIAKSMGSSSDRASTPPAAPLAELSAPKPFSRKRRARPSAAAASSVTSASRPSAAGVGGAGSGREERRRPSVSSSAAAARPTGRPAPSSASVGRAAEPPRSRLMGARFSPPGAALPAHL
eukprot:scaffold52900_cov23-Tisochrysis_lutea.AAC.1